MTASDSLGAASPNAETIGLWNETLVPRFIRHRQVFVGASAPHSQEALARHPVGAGEAVLDVGCGFGETTIEIAQAVGPKGRALGVDVCEPFLAIARADATRSGVPNARFRVADAQVERFDDKFDVCFSRFGTMFFSNPAAAFRNLRRCVKPEGRLLMIVWRPIEDNEWTLIARNAARVHLPPPPDEAPACGPGPFSLADADVVKAILAAAKWDQAALERVDRPINLGPTIEAAVEFMLTLGPAGQILREAGALGEAKRPAVAADLAERLRPFLTDAGVVMRAGSWCVSARAGR